MTVWLQVVLLFWRGLLGQSIPFPGPGRAPGGAPPPSGDPFILTISGSSPASDATACRGFRFTVGAAAITVTDLGRWVISGNSGTHTILIATSGGSGSVLASASVNTSGAGAGAFIYTSITPLGLSAATDYWILSVEANGGDQWYTDSGTLGTTLTTTVDAVMVGQIGTSAGSPCDLTDWFAGNASDAYGPPSFKYTIP